MADVCGRNRGDLLRRCGRPLGTHKTYPRAGAVTFGIVKLAKSVTSGCSQKPSNKPTYAPRLHGRADQCDLRPIRFTVFRPGFGRKRNPDLQGKNIQISPRMRLLNGWGISCDRLYPERRLLRDHEALEHSGYFGRSGLYLCLGDHRQIHRHRHCPDKITSADQVAPGKSEPSNIG